MPSGHRLASGLDLARFEKQRAKYARRRMRTLRLRSPWLPEDILDRANLRRISYCVRRAGAGQTRLAEQTAPDAGSEPQRHCTDADEMQRRNAAANTQESASALIQTKLSSPPESKVFTTSEDSGSESSPTPHE